MPLTPERLAAWRDGIGYVPQESFLLNDTIVANLRRAAPEATDEEIAEALRLAAADFVAELPDGLATLVGDRGIALSGGERQRLALARALLRRPRLLVLDEATSNLDAENERRIVAAVDELRHRMTIVVITHRLYSVRHADVIHLLERGRLVESGTWDELVAAGRGRLAALVRTQGVDPTAPVRVGPVAPVGP